jgi:hypothetical protein
MPTVNNITTTYAGEARDKFISAALLSSTTIEGGGVEVRTQVKFKEVVRRLEIDGIVKNATCDFDPTSTLTMTERILQPEEFQVNLILCKKDYRSGWDSMSMGASAHDSMPPSFADYLVAYVAAKVAQKNEQNIWRGVNANVGEFDGFVTKLTTDAALPAANEVTGIAITAANVIAELGKIVDAIPATLYGKEDLSIYIPQNVYRAYVRALGGFATGGQGAAGYKDMGNNQKFGDLMFDGVSLFVANGLPNNVCIAAERSNLFFGTGILDDHAEVKVIDTSETLGDQNVRIVMRFTAGVQYGVVEDIVTYGVVNAANPA